jgi:hypothetical protein
VVVVAEVLEVVTADETGDETGELTAEDVVEVLDDTTTGVDDETTVDVVVGEKFKLYTFRRSGPPQYSELFPAHNMPQPDVAGCPPFWKVLPHPEGTRSALSEKSLKKVLTAFDRVLCAREHEACRLTRRRAGCDSQRTLRSHLTSESSSAGIAAGTEVSYHVQRAGDRTTYV